MRIAICALLLLSAAACSSTRAAPRQTASTRPAVRVTADTGAAARRPMLWVVNGRVLGRAADPQQLTVPGFEPLDASLIERVEVLKGRAATAEFGEAGADGVVIVTTRQVLRERRD